MTPQSLLSDPSIRTGRCFASPDYGELVSSAGLTGYVEVAGLRTWHEVAVL